MSALVVVVVVIVVATFRFELLLIFASHASATINKKVIFLQIDIEDNKVKVL